MPATHKAILEALAKLDTSNDAHWTADDLPRVEIVEEFLGDDTTRAVLNEIAKDFNRKNPVLTGTEGSTQNPPTVLEDDEGGSDEQESSSSEVSQKKDEIQKRLDEAKEFLVDSQIAYKEVQQEMDIVIAEEEALNLGGTTASDIKRFQESQQRQRRKEAGKLDALKTFLANQ